MPGKAPVERVGGTQEDGPWPEEVEEIVAGESYERLIETPTGSKTVSVTVQRVEEIERGGQVVSFTHTGGGSQ